MVGNGGGEAGCRWMCGGEGAAPVASSMCSYTLSKFSPISSNAPPARAQGSYTHALALPLMLEHALQAATTRQRPRVMNSMPTLAALDIVLLGFARRGFASSFDVPGAGCVGMMMNLFGVLHCVVLKSQLAAWRAARKPAGEAGTRCTTESKMHACPGACAGGLGRTDVSEYNCPRSSHQRCMGIAQP